MRLVALLLSSVAAWSPADTIHLRGGEGEVIGEIKSIDGSGIRLQLAEGTTRAIPWDQIRDIDAPAHQVLASTYASRAAKLFRARSRVVRGDYAMAEPLLAELFDPGAAAATETNLVIAQGLLRCRLARGANTQAVVPFLQASRWMEAGATLTGDVAQVPVIDAATGASEHLPPVFIGGTSTQVLRRALENLDVGTDGKVAGWRDLYLYALSPRGGPMSPPAHADVIAWDMVAAIDADPDVRAAARARLSEALKEEGLPSWRETWARFALGRSLLQESSPMQRQRGMLQAATVVATAGRTQPFLAGIALRLMADHEADSGRHDTAAWLEAELRQTMPGHPLLDKTLGD